MKAANSNGYKAAKLEHNEVLEPQPYQTQTLQVHNLSLIAGLKTLLERVNFTASAGQCVAVVGESGSGKSITALACARLLPDSVRVHSGDVILAGLGGKASSADQTKDRTKNRYKNHAKGYCKNGNKDPVNVLDIPRSALYTVRGRRIGFVFQEPSLALNPVLTIGQQLMEAIGLHSDLSTAALKIAAINALSEVGIDHANSRLNDYPMQFSGGQKQRIMIAMALAGQPDVLIADEPTTALDVLVQAQVLKLLDELKSSRGMALVLITHDLAVAKTMAQQIIVMQAGTVVEHASAQAFFAKPQHAYSQALLAANLLPVYCAAHNLDAMPLLSVHSVHAAYMAQTALWRKPVTNQVLRGVCLQLLQGQTLALIGASGSGKTTLAKVLLGLQDRHLHCSGQINLAGLTMPAGSQSSRQLSRQWQQTVSVVFQDPYASLNPRLKIGEIVMEGVRNLRPEWSSHQAQERVLDLLSAVDLPADSLLRWPHEFSGGQRQRIAIVRALAVAPKLLVLDEPTSALDMTVQTKLIKLLVDLQQRYGYSYLLITHNFQVVKSLAQHVAVLHDGQLVEYGLTAQVLANPQHEQTKALLAAVPQL